jgi:hypothetical protein
LATYDSEARCHIALGQDLPNLASQAYWAHS